MIWELLQERNTLRKDKKNLENELQEMSMISTQEMKKWARLTDEMQQEIEFLKEQQASTILEGKKGRKLFF
jgi:hypothetical protein